MVRRMLKAGTQRRFSPLLLGGFEGDLRDGGAHVIYRETRDEIAVLNASSLRDFGQVAPASMAPLGHSGRTTLRLACSAI